MTSTSEELLRGLALFSDVDVQGLARLLTHTELAAGDELWRQGEAADAVYIVESGRVQVTVRLPGQRASALATLTAGEVVGELALLDGGTRTADVRALTDARLLRLGHRDFRALVLGRDQGAHVLRRRITELACARLAERHRALAATLTGGCPVARAGDRRSGPAPDTGYLLRLPFFRHFRAIQLEELLREGAVERVDAGAALVSEGEMPQSMFVTLNGAVEEVIRRGDRAIRVGLAGPGRGFGYAAAIAGTASTAAAVARERSVVLTLPRQVLTHRLDADPFAQAIEHDVVTALRQAERPQARLAAGDRLISGR